MNRIITLTIALLLMGIMLMACGGQEPAAPTASDSSDVVTDETADNKADDEAVQNCSDEETASTTDAESCSEEPTSEESDPSKKATPIEPTEETEADMIEPIEIDETAGVTTETGLQLIETEAGEGDSPQAGDIVAVHYTGMLLDGSVFDSSLTRGEPIEFRLGKGQVIAGWDEGIAMLKAGSKARLVIPSELGYGERGSGSIPPNSTLVFDVELVSFTPGPPGAPDAPQAVEADDFIETDTGLQYYDIEDGEGEAATAGQRVTVHYTGWLTDGVMFDSSLERGEPIDLVLGAGQVIPGWEEGVAGMQVGCKRQLVIPAALAYGERGAGGVIPPDATLVFELELLKLEDGPPGAPEAPQEIEADDFTETDSGLQYYDFEVGEGETPETGQIVAVHYTGWLTDGTKFDSSLDRGEPIQFPIGQGRVIPGWDEGVGSMTVGGKRQLVIPSELAYGEQGAGGAIPPGATLIFEVELLDIQ